MMLILLSWLDEFHSSWHESAIESAAVLAAWIVVFYYTRKLVARLYYLEGFLQICAWCHKINREGSWVPMEQYFSEGFDTKTSHGVCPECASKLTTQIGQIAKKPGAP